MPTSARTGVRGATLVLLGALVAVVLAGEPTSREATSVSDLALRLSVCVDADGVVLELLAKNLTSHDVKVPAYCLEGNNVYITWPDGQPRKVWLSGEQTYETIPSGGSRSWLFDLGAGKEAFGPGRYVVHWEVEGRKSNEVFFVRRAKDGGPLATRPASRPTTSVH
jgi:hypothetical protein